jgi:tape measure domain-containing protein
VADTTRLIIELETILRGLDKTLRGLDQVKKSLQSVVNVKAGTQQTANVNKTAVAAQKLQQQQDRAVVSARRLAQQQQALEVRAQQLGNAQTRATQVTQRLANAQQRLDTATATTTARVGQQADAHVRAFRAIQRGVDNADAHVRFFRANEAALARAPQLDAHVKAFRNIEAAARKSTQNILGIGNALRSVGQGLASIGATLSVAITAPLVAAGVASIDAAVRLDSLKRGLAAITGSADEANRQLARLTQLAKLPGIGFEEAIQGSIRLQAVGFSAQEAERNLREFANAIALTGGGRDELARVTVQLGQLAAKGKVLSQDLRPIIEAAPAVGRALLQAFGTVNADDIQDLGLSTKQFLDILVGQLSELPRAAAGAKNSFENFRDEVFRAASAVGEALLPSLIRLAEVVGPIITKLADTFAKLPQPLQIVVIGAAGLLAAFGPLAFVVGQLTLGVGRLLVGFVELNAAGILPTIVNLRALAAGTLGAAAAQRTLAATSALVTGAVGGILTIIGAAVAAYATYNAFQKDAVTLSKERAEQLTAEINALEKQAKFLNGLRTGVERTADEQQRLLEIYDKLNVQAQVRVQGISDEEKRLLVLRAELERLIKLREQERLIQAATLAGSLATSLATVAANEEEIQSITDRVQANAQLIESLREAGKISSENARLLGQRGIGFQDVEAAIGALQAESESLVRTQAELRKATDELNGSSKEQAEVLLALEKQTGFTARQLLVAAKNMGVFRGDIEQTLTLLQRYVRDTKDAADATDEFSRALKQQQTDLARAGDQADTEAKRRRSQISSAVSLAREASDSFAGALKFLQAFIAAQPGLRADIERERQLQGKSLSEFLQDALGGRRGAGAGTTLRNAQEQLAQSLADVAQASAEEQQAIEQVKNARLLQENENAFNLQLIAYRQYLNERARLTNAGIQFEINEQQKVVDAATAERDRFLERAGRTGLPAAERTRAQGGAAEADERRIKAQTRITELQGRQKANIAEIDQLLRESSKQQQDDVRKLEIEFAELRGRIEDAANAATDDRFRESLQALARAQDDINKRLQLFGKLLSAEERQQLEADRAQNQRQINAIENLKEQEDALASLAAANELVRRAKERQAQLEEDLTFQVEFRGLSEEAAIARRLEGENRLNDSLTVARETIRQIVAALEARGVEPPRALIEFLDTLRTEVKGLGELSFSEQFRLAQKEFDRLNDQRLQKIADVERAVRNRDIAEAEGLLLIRRINGEYVGDLEQQLVLLKQIAAVSGDPTLQRQAADAAEVAKDAGDELASLDKQIRATSIDALQDGFTDFFKSVTDRTRSAQDKLLAFVDSVAQRINDVIAEHLGQQLIESLFGGGAGQGEGIIASIKRLFGFGGGGEGKAASTIDAVAGKATEETGAVAAATTLQTGATVAAATLQTGAATAASTDIAASVAFSTSIATSAAAFASSVIAAGAAFAASVAAGAGAQAVGGLGGALGAAAGDIVPARPGGVFANIAEAGHTEAVLTTDPRHAARQARILTRFLKLTRGLQGRFPVPRLAEGALITPRQAEANLLAGITRTPLTARDIADIPLAAEGGGELRLRQVLVDERNVGDWMNSSEGEQVFRDKLRRNAPIIRQLGGRG